MQYSKKESHEQNCLLKLRISELDKLDFSLKSITFDPINANNYLFPILL